MISSANAKASAPVFDDNVVAKWRQVCSMIISAMPFISNDVTDDWTHRCALRKGVNLERQPQPKCLRMKTLAKRHRPQLGTLFALDRE